MKISAMKSTMMVAWCLVCLCIAGSAAAQTGEAQVGRAGQGRQVQPPAQTQPQGQGQNRPGRVGGQGPQVPGGGAVQDAQEMFDAYALVQAQRVLQLNDEQYQRFFPRLRTLQDIRRRHQQTRMRMLNELRRMNGPQRAEDAVLVEQARLYDEAMGRFHEEERAARRAIDEVISPRQRAIFRFFEEDMERQKVDFITRARRQGGQGLPGGLPGFRQ
jgi:hypothetical protein